MSCAWEELGVDAREAKNDDASLEKMPANKGVCLHPNLTIIISTPKNITVFVSLDNIQKLMKSYRITSKEQEKTWFSDFERLYEI